MSRHLSRRQRPSQLTGDTEFKANSRFFITDAEFLSCITGFPVATLTIKFPVSAPPLKGK